MARTPSNMVALGTKAPEFSLFDTVSGKIKNLNELRSEKATLVMFICNHCPFVEHIQEELSKIGREYGEKGVSVIAMSANDVEDYPEDSPDKMKAIAARYDYTFPYLYDETQEVAKAYNAACTPDFFLYDKDLLLVYRGQLDDSRPGDKTPVTGRDLRAALDAVLAGEPVHEDQIPSIGCNIKWRA